MIIGLVKPIGKNILVTDMNFDQTIRSSGVIIPSDDGTSTGVKPRWGKVWAIGPEQKDVAVGEWVLVQHGRWSRGIEIQENGQEIIIRQIDIDAILLVDDQPHNDY